MFATDCRLVACSTCMCHKPFLSHPKAALTKRHEPAAGDDDRPAVSRPHGPHHRPDGQQRLPVAAQRVDGRHGPRLGHPRLQDVPGARCDRTSVAASWTRSLSALLRALCKQNGLTLCIASVPVPADQQSLLQTAGNGSVRTYLWCICLQSCKGHERPAHGLQKRRGASQTRSQLHTCRR